MRYLLIALSLLLVGFTPPQDTAPTYVVPSAPVLSIWSEEPSVSQYFIDFRETPTGEFTHDDFTAVFTTNEVTNSPGGMSVVSADYPQGNALRGSSGSFANIGYNTRHGDKASIAIVRALNGLDDHQNVALSLWFDGPGYLVGGTDGYATRWFSNVIQVYTIIGSTLNSRGIAVLVPADGDTYRFDAEQDGTSVVLKVFVNDVELLSFTHTTPLVLPVGGGVASFSSRSNEGDSATYSIGVGTNGSPAPTEPLFLPIFTSKVQNTLLRR